MSVHKIAIQELTCSFWSCAPPSPPASTFLTYVFGQVMPVHRGGGIDQALFLDFARQMAAGRWVHIFPEARVVQTGTLATDAITRRDSKELEHKGMLKWGTGKLIAHSRVPPIVVPFYRELALPSQKRGRRIETDCPSNFSLILNPFRSPFPTLSHSRLLPSRPSFCITSFDSTQLRSESIHQNQTSTPHQSVRSCSHVPVSLCRLRDGGRAPAAQCVENKGKWGALLSQ